MILQNYTELIAAAILVAVLTVFTLGKSPFFRTDRAGAAIIGASLTMACGVLSFDEAMRAVDHRTIVVLFSMMVVVAVLKAAGLFERIGQLILRRISTKKSLLLATILISGVLSAVAINDIVCLLFTPVVLGVCRRGGCAPLPHLLGLAMASNIGSAATFLGNPQNILIGRLSRLPFLDYLRVAAPISLVGLLLLYLMLAKAYAASLQGTLAAVAAPRETHFHRYLTLKALGTLALILAFYIAGGDIALVSSLGAAFLLLTRRVKPNRIYTGVDFNLLVIFIGLFIVVGGIASSGLLARLDELLTADRMHALGFFGLAGIVLSNIVSNVPAVLLLQYYIPAGSAAHWQALALLSTIAGNLTLFGSIANLIVAEIARKQNVAVGAGAYFRIGCPLTLLLALLTVLWLEAVG